MKVLVYGCGQLLRFTLQKFKVDYSLLEFTDSNEEIWGNKFIEDKVILSKNSIDVNDYDFCLLGSKVFGEELYNEALKLGFDNRQIIPYEFIISIWERWKKNEFHVAWKKQIEDPHVEIVNNWHMIGSDAVCILKTKDLLLYDITFKVYEIYEVSRSIELWTVEENIQLGKFDRETPLTYRSECGEELIKIVVKDAVLGVPWCSLSYEKSDLRNEIDECKLSKQFLSTYKTLLNFPAYDEDYTALTKVGIAESKRGTILDVGANYGQSMYAFYNLTNSNIISLEVVPNLYEVLTKLKKIIDSEARINIINSGVSDVEKDLIWYEPSDPIMSGSFDVDFISGRKLGVDIFEREMHCDTLDHLVGIRDDIWFIKMDVEGLEYEALRGATEIIEKNHPLILIEQNEKIKDIEKMLSDEYDIRYYNLYADRFDEERLSRLNCWLIPKEQFRSDLVNEFLLGRM